ncbi:chloride channel protein [Leeia oryzae]|uniref:chloride channel protein n=1 Tax=Leeia oryzae TaxID=356662 RepID=UPI00037C3FEA|nr:chloride channel protein [Leeia oryzae]
MQLIQLRTTINRIIRHIDWKVWHGRIVVWCAAIAAAITIVLFAKLVDGVINEFNSLRRLYWWSPLILTTFGGMVIAYLTRKWFAGSEGSGIPQVIAALQMSESESDKSALVSIRIAIGKIFLGAAALLAGFSSGREGPSVQVGASIMYEFRRFLPKRFPVTAHHLLLAGGAAGIAAAFNTPLAGIVFAIEELGKKFEERTNGVLLTAIILAGVIAISVQGNYTYFGRLAVDKVSRDLFLPILMAGLICGLSGGLFSRVMVMASKPWPGFAGFIKSRHPIIFAGICGLIVALLGLASNGLVHGSGYTATQQALEGDTALPFLFAFEKMLATLVSYFAAIPGGIFAPSLAVGAGLGQDLFHLGLGHISGTAWMALCMAGFLAAVTQAPITSFVIVMEMIDGHAMVISLIAVAFIANFISKLLCPPLYHTLAGKYLGKADTHKT